MKKFLSLLMSLVMLFSITAGIDISAQAAVATLLWPVFDSSGNPYKTLTSHNADSSSGHQGIDISAPIGAKWYAPYNATVDTVYTGCKTNANGDHSKCSPNHGKWKAGNGKYICNDGFGNGVMLKCSISGSTYYIHCAHMNSVSSSIKAGQSIKQGTYLGTVGDRGFSYGAHAHFQIVKGSNKWAANTCCNDPTHSHCAFSYKYSLSTSVTNPSVTVKAVSDLKDTSAKINFTANNPSKVTIKTVGVQVRRKGDSQWNTKTEAMNSSYVNASSVPMWWTVGKGKEFNITLYPGITYEYRAYVVYNGNNYYSSTSTFTTKGTHTHSWNSGTVTTSATCTQNGVKTYSCSICKATKTEIIPANGHYWNSGQITKSSTCTEQGVKTYTCYNCYATRTESIPAKGHNWDSGTVVKNATCNENGSMQYKCTRCNAIRTTIIYLKGHNFSTYEPYCLNGCNTPNPDYVKPVTDNALDNGLDNYYENYFENYHENYDENDYYTIPQTATKDVKAANKSDSTSIKKLTKGKKSFKVTFKKVSGVSGYQVQYSTDKKFKKNKKTVGVKKAKTSATVKKLKSNKKYYVRVRTYKTVRINGKSAKIYSSWSKIKSVKTK